MHAVFTAVKEFKVYTETQFQCKVMQTQIDNRTDKFKNQEWQKIVIKINIQHEFLSLNAHNFTYVIK